MSISPDISIRHAELRDAVGLRDMHAHPDVYKGTMQLPFPPEDRWKPRLEALPHGSINLVADAKGVIVGHASLIANPKALRRKHAAGLGMAIHHQWQRQGIATEMLRLLIDAADNWLDFRRLELDVFADNLGAIKLYEKFGFELEGRHKAHSFRNGSYVDVLTMARLRNL